LLILGAFSPVKLTWSSPFIPGKIKDYERGIMLPKTPSTRKVVNVSSKMIGIGKLPG
jgi:hypothetical protein